MTDTHEHEIRAFTLAIRAGTALMHADLSVPDHARGVVLFAHGAGSSRFSRRNRIVAAALQASGFATLLPDLITPAEEADAGAARRPRFDIDLLAARVIAATDWLVQDPSTRALPIGYFGASTGAAAALVAAAHRPDRIDAIVSRGGRPDLAATWLARVRAPTLLIVGGRDHEVLQLNRLAQRELGASSVMSVIPGATHLFEEPGALDAVSERARGWFADHLKVATVARADHSGW